jgi:hypothetical protein
MSNPYLETGVVAKTLTALLADVQESYDLGDVLSPPSQGESLSDLHNRLIQVRSRQTRISDIVGDLVRLQSTLRKSVIDKEGELEEAQSGVVVEKKWAVEEFRSAAEKNARLAGKTVEQKIAVRAAKKLLLDVDSSLEYARVKHRELGSQVNDVNTRLRIINLDGDWSV